MINDIVEVAAIIDEKMMEYVKDNPDDIAYGQQNAEDFALGAVLVACCGHVNPALIQSMCKLHRTPFKDSNYSLQC